MSSEDPQCGSGGGSDTFFHLRVASLFIILVTSTAGALFPVLAKRSSWLRVPGRVFDFAKFFGSGVIIATAFIHLLAPGIEALNSPCLSPAWHLYPYPLALSLLSIFSIFIIELLAFRWGSAKLAKLGKTHDPHGHQLGAHAAHGPETISEVPKGESKTTAEYCDDSDPEDAKHRPTSITDNVMAQMIGVAILEFGVMLHSVLIGLTLAVDEQFKILFIVIVFHQTFEGLGIGSRLAFLKLGPKYQWLATFGALLYGITTPIGIAAGLAIRTTYNPSSTTASIVSGVLDSLSSGILIYTGLVELLAHEFLFNRDMIQASNGKVLYAVSCMCFGCAIMALLGRWA